MGETHTKRCQNGGFRLQKSLSISLYEREKQLILENLPNLGDGAVEVDEWTGAFPLNACFF